MVRQKKDELIDKVSQALGRAVLAVVLGALAIGLPVGGLYVLAGEFEYSALRWVAVGLALCLPGCFGAGFWFARREVKGFLGGFNRGVDTSIDGLAKVVNLRDNSKVRVAKESRTQAKPAVEVFLPPASLPTITHRQLTQGEIIEL